MFKTAGPSVLVRKDGAIAFEAWSEVRLDLAFEFEPGRPEPAFIYGGTAEWREVSRNLFLEVASIRGANEDAFFAAVLEYARKRGPIGKEVWRLPSREYVERAWDYYSATLDICRATRILELLKMSDLELQRSISWDSSGSILIRHKGGGSYAGHYSLPTPRDRSNASEVRTWLGECLRIEVELGLVGNVAPRFTGSNSWTLTLGPRNILGQLWLGIPSVMAGEATIGHCGYCGETFLIVGRALGKGKKFCSDACRQAKHRSNRRREENGASTQ